MADPSATEGEDKTKRERSIVPDEAALRDRKGRRFDNDTVDVDYDESKEWSTRRHRTNRKVPFWREFVEAVKLGCTSTEVGNTGYCS